MIQEAHCLVNINKIETIINLPTAAANCKLHSSHDQLLGYH